MGTSAQIKNVSVVSLSYNKLTVTAIVTAGVETNAGRVGDYAEFSESFKKLPLGTINIMLVINADMSKGAMTRALVTCTEAKTAALQELMVDSRFSNGLATGTGTDQTIIAVNSDSELYYESAGKHSKIGELIGKTVISAVKEALAKQGNLTPELQHNLLRRLRRFGITEETIWEQYLKITDKPIKKKNIFNDTLKKISCSSPVFSYGILYIHLIDEYLWHLTSEEETKQTAVQLLKILSDKLDINCPSKFCDKSQGCERNLGVMTLEVESMKNLELILALAVENNIKNAFRSK